MEEYGEQIEEDTLRIENKEKILQTIKQSALSMQSELMEIMKAQYAQKIQEV